MTDTTRERLIEEWHERKRSLYAHEIPTAEMLMPDDMWIEQAFTTIEAAARAEEREVFGKQQIEYERRLSCYYNLLNAVESKIEGESRYDTALRYITEAAALTEDYPANPQV